MLLRHAVGAHGRGQPLQLHGGPATRFLPCPPCVHGREKLKPAVVGFHFGRLLRENPGMQAAAWNFMNVRGCGKRTWMAGDSGCGLPRKGMAAASAVATRSNGRRRRRKGRSR